MKIKSIYFLLIIILLLSGCIQTKGFSVKVGPLEDATKIKDAAGIPFYKKIPIFVQTSIYLSPFYEIKLYVSEGKVGNEVTATSIPSAKMLIFESDLTKFSNFVNDAQRLESAADVISKFNGTLPLTEQYKIRGVDAFKGVSQRTDSEKEKMKLPELYSNNIETKIVVDWLNLYYLNYMVPLAGSSSLTAEFSPEGTLNKAVGETEDKTLETIIGAVSSFLPIKEFFTKKWGVGETTAELFKPVTKRTTKIIHISLEVEKKICKYTLTKTCRTANEISEMIALDDKLASRGLEVIDSASAKKDEKKDAAKNAIEFAGQVKMPEEKKDDKK